MFGKGILSGWRLQIMSAFVTGLMMSSSMLYGGNPQIIIREVKKEIRHDGLSMSYSANEEFDEFTYLMKMFADNDDAKLKQIMTYFEMMNKVTTEIGMDDVDGYGSSVAKKGDLYDSDAFVHLKPGNERSLIWKVLGGKSQKLTTFDLLPENTILSKTFRVNPAILWKFIKKSAGVIKIPAIPVDLEAQLAQVEQMAASQGMPIQSVVNSLTTETSLFISVNKKKTMRLPDMPPMPQMGLTAIMQKQDLFIQNFVLMALTQAPVVKSKVGDFQVLTLNMPLPTGTKAGFAYNEHEMIFSSDINIVEKIVKAKAGKGLVSTKKFQKYSSISRVGNGAFYVSQDISNYISEQLKTLPTEMSFAAKSYSMAFFQDKTPGLFGVYGKKPNGIKFDMLSTFNAPAGTSSTLVVVAVIGILAAMILPALGNARKKAKMAVSKSNLKNMGTTVAAFFADGTTSKYPKTLAEMDFDSRLFTHPLENERATLEEVMKGNSNYIPLFKAGAVYEGDATKPLFMEKPGLWGTSIVYIVFEDGHVEGIRGDSVEDVLKVISRYK